MRELLREFIPVPIIFFALVSGLILGVFIGIGGDPAPCAVVTITH